MKSDLKNGSTAEETFFTDNGVYTDNTTAAATPGTVTSALPNWSPSTNITTVTFSQTGSAYKIVGTSTSGKFFCFSSTNSGKGVVTIATLATAC